MGTYATLPAGVTGLANLSGTDRYVTNRNVAHWAKDNAGLAFTHIGLATGDKFPDALASGPYLRPRTRHPAAQPAERDRCLRCIGGPDHRQRRRGAST